MYGQQTKSERFAYDCLLAGKKIDAGYCQTKNCTYIKISNEINHDGDEGRDNDDK